MAVLTHTNLADSPWPRPLPRGLVVAYWALAALTFAGAGVMSIVVPADQRQGLIQKIFYIHLPVAINAFLACMTVFIASVGFLVSRKLWWDDLAVSAAKAAVLLCGIVLLTGMIWGKYAWGSWWEWTPRLTFSLLLWLLYVVYLILRGSIDSEQKRCVIGAVYGIVAFLDVPLVYLSSKLIPDIHPANITLETSMKWTLAAWFVPVTLITVGLIRAGYMVQAARRLRLETLDTGGPEQMNLSLLGETA